MNSIPQIVPITDLRKSSPDVLDLLTKGPVFLAQRSRPAAQPPCFSPPSSGTASTRS